MEEDVRTECPNCEDGHAGRVEKQRRGDEVTVTLTCDECESDWTRSLRFD